MKAKILGPAGFERTVVLKRVLPHLAKDRTFIESSCGGAAERALAPPEHRPVFELGEIDRSYFMALEFVDGHDLGRVMRALIRRGARSDLNGAAVLRDVARALAYAHDRKTNGAARSASFTAT